MGGDEVFPIVTQKIYPGHPSRYMLLIAAELPATVEHASFTTESLTTDDFVSAHVRWFDSRTCTDNSRTIAHVHGKNIESHHTAEVYIAKHSGACSRRVELELSPTLGTSLRGTTNVDVRFIDVCGPSSMITVSSASVVPIQNICTNTSSLPAAREYGGAELSNRGR